MRVSVNFLASALFAGTALGAACPFAMLRSAGLLSPEDAAAYEAVKADPAHAKAILDAHEAKTREAKAHEARAEPEATESESESEADLEDRDLFDDLNNLLGDVEKLTLGGGLINGLLQPLSGPLEKLDIPTPQKQGLKLIPGDDPDHQFIAPGPTDQRGICPTLNTLANHGYLSRDGITTFAESANAVQIAFGFDFPLSVFLSAVGLLAAGDLITGKYSIGGADDRVPNTLGPALGLGKHGVFEIDGSITREDVYFGNNANFIQQRWDEYVAISEKHGGLFGRETQAEDNGFRYDVSRATNPQFFAGAIWFIVSHAERVFVYTGLANGTTENIANYDNVAPFFLNETFPPYWYRRGDPWTLPFTFEEAGRLFLNAPRPLGANEGLGNFVPLGLNFTLETPAQLVCFVIENIFDLAPGQLQTLVGGALDIVTGFLKGIIVPLVKNDGYFNCNFTEFTKPSTKAGQDKKGGFSASGSPINGAYPGIGIIKPDYKNP